MRRAVINVVENACHSMMDDNLRIADSDARLTIATDDTGDRIEIRITDTGAGIPDDVMEKIFEPLYSTKGFGVGLGMPTVKQIVEQHGGNIKVNSRLGVGSVFSFSLQPADTV